MSNISSFFFRAKLREIKAGVDGFMVYDIGMVETMHKVGSTTLYTFPIQTQQWYSPLTT